MKTILLVLLMAFASTFITNGQTVPDPANNGSNGAVEVYYFHFSARCITCMTVESEAKADVESLYGGKVSFKAVNLDDNSNTALAQKLKVSGQTLLIVKGSEKINITNEGFLYARTNPEKLKSVIKEKVDGLLKL